jgi:thioredoxin reductase
MESVANLGIKRAKPWNEAGMRDVLIIGGGPAGLSAALMLGRCRRKVLVCDKGEPRNAASKALHGFLTRDGIDPREFLRIAREQLTTYPNVEVRNCEIVDIKRHDQYFAIHEAHGQAHRGRIVLFATGIVDELPRIPRSSGDSKHAKAVSTGSDATSFYPCDDASC